MLLSGCRVKLSKTLPRGLEAFCCVELRFMEAQTLRLLGVVMCLMDFMVPAEHVVFDCSSTLRGTLSLCHVVHQFFG